MFLDALRRVRGFTLRGPRAAPAAGGPRVAPAASGPRAPHLALALALAACSGDPQGRPVALGAPAPSATNVPPAATTVSAKGRVNFKGGRRYADDLARALSLPRAELCRELSSFDCADEVHAITLGGVAPYAGAIYRPSRERTVSSANAVDRIALNACAERARRDFATPEQAALFGELARPVGGGGAGPNSDELGIVATRLYTRLLGRAPAADEREALASFHAELAGELGRGAPERFAALACYAVASSEEALFY